MLITLIAAALLGLIPAWIASSRGRSFGLWWIFGALLFIVALPMSIMLKKPLPGEPVPTGDTNVPLWATVTVILVAIGLAILFAGGDPSPKDISMAKFLAVKAGMNEAEVVSIIGRPGEEISRNEMPDVPGVTGKMVTVMYGWSNPDGSNMNVMFQDDKLLMKAQHGLE